MVKLNHAGIIQIHTGKDHEQVRATEQKQIDRLCCNKCLKQNKRKTSSWSSFCKYRISGDGEPRD